MKKENNRVYIYAVILDASDVYYMKSIEKYMCTMKLIDDTINSTQTFMGKPGFISVSFFSRNKFEIPQINRIGTVIRIHRGDTRAFRGSYQLNCDTGIKGAWVLFDSVTGYSPLVHSGRTYTFIENDKKRLKVIREFGQKFLAKEDLNECTAINSSIEEVDMLAMLLKRKEKDKVYDQLTIFDGENFFKIKIPKLRYSHIGVQDIIRIRGLTENKESELVINDYTNIMKIDKEYNSAVELLEKVENAKKIKTLRDKFELFIPISNTSRVLSEVMDKKKEVVALKALLKKDIKTIEGKKYRLNVNILEFGPKNPKDWVIPITPELRECYGLEGTMKCYYKLQMFAKDFYDIENRDVYRLYLCSIDGKGKEFFPASAENDPLILKRIYKLLTKSWFHLDLMVETVVSGGEVLLFVVNTKLII